MTALYRLGRPDCLWMYDLGSAPAIADVVTDWNAIAVPAVQAGRPGPIGIVDLALVHAAVHDAVQAIEGRFQPYHVKISGASGSPAAAAAAAAYGVLIGFYPGQAGVLTPTYQVYLTGNNLVNDPGLAVGQLVAGGILPLRRLDPSPLPTPFIWWHEPGRVAPDRVVSSRPAPLFRSDGNALVRSLPAVHVEKPDTVSRSQAARFEQRAICSRV